MWVCLRKIQTAHGSGVLLPVEFLARSPAQELLLRAYQGRPWRLRLLDPLLGVLAFCMISLRFMNAASWLPLLESLQRATLFKAAFYPLRQDFYAFSRKSLRGWEIRWKFGTQLDIHVQQCTNCQSSSTVDSYSMFRMISMFCVSGPYPLASIIRPHHRAISWKNLNLLLIIWVDASDIFPETWLNAPVSLQRYLRKIWKRPTKLGNIPERGPGGGPLHF